jgi:hypothetical protein
MTLNLDLWLALTLAAAILGLSTASWWITKTVNLLLASHTQILKHQILLDQAIMQMVPLPDWRQLPPDARLMMRNSLVEVLREMDAEMPARN